MRRSFCPERGNMGAVVFLLIARGRVGKGGRRGEVLADAKGSIFVSLLVRFGVKQKFVLTTVSVIYTNNTYSSASRDQSRERATLPKNLWLHILIKMEVNFVL